jgi:hypothetical protein
VFSNVTPRNNSHVTEGTQATNELVGEIMGELGRRLNALTPWHVRVRGWVGPRRGRLARDARFFPADKAVAWIGISRLLPPSRSASGTGLDVGRAADDVVFDALEGFQQTLWNDDHYVWPHRRSEPRVNCSIEDLPRARAVIVQDELRMWFEDDRGVVLELEPITLPSSPT